MRKLIFIWLICFYPLMLMGQSAEEEVIRLKQAKPGAEDLKTTDEQSTGELYKEGGQSGDKVQGNWNMSIGSGYSFMKGYGSGMMFYAAPAYTLPLNNRLAFHGGMIAARYQGLGQAFSGESLLPGSFYSFSVFAAASYRMNERLILHGTGVKQLLSAPVSPFTPYPMDNLSFGATYKLGENISIGASLHMNNGRTYYATPFGGHSFQSPFYW